MNNQAPQAIETLIRLEHAFRAIQSRRRGSKPWHGLELTMAQFKAVLLLAACSGLPSRVLGSRLGLRPSAVTPLVDRLVANGLVTRESDPADRRVVHVKASRKATALAQRLMETNRAVVAEVLEAVPERERASVHKAVSVLLEAAARVQAKHEANPER